jgi:hypothetical protein
MTPTHARAKAAKPSKATSPPKSRKRADAVRDLPPTVVRLPPELRERLDTIVARRNVALAAQGATTSRAALLVTAAREFCDREDASAQTPEAAPPAHR